ncbi:MAG: DUF86 domain-containing protein [Sporanaerobacter sp.]|jgi:uncharacterized protein YutE (UPF0331/DUF86 family)|uniref:HepT-like ribonuclease domain-containing protein n=1 Tax=Sporanaerobacter sp. TaxID=2010183 RepID=UPI003A0FDF94
MTKDVYDIICRKFKELENNLIFLKQVSFDVNEDNLKEDMIRYWGIERNILVHNYTKIDEDMIIYILKNELDDFIKYMDYVDKWLKENYK